MIWNKKSLSERYNATLNGITISAGELNFTVSGTYEFYFASSVYSAGFHISRLYNDTSSTALEYGVSNSASTTSPISSGISSGYAVLTITIPAVIRLEHYTTTGFATNGLGFPVSVSGVSEVYASLLVKRIA